ncbi:hypothetical protein PMAYCL1PPCAC_23229, partial [Pristionchus mayeri]
HIAIVIGEMMELGQPASFAENVEFTMNNIGAPASNGLEVRVGAVDFEFKIRRLNNNEPRPVGAIVRCHQGSIDPHWYVKFELHYRLHLKNSDNAIEAVHTFEANSEKKEFFVGQFEIPSESPPNDTEMWVSIKLLKWNAIHSPLIMDFTRRNHLTDAILVVEDKKLFITKSIIAMQSAFFKRLFDERPNEEEMKINDVKVADMIVLLTLLYPQCTHDQIFDLLNPLTRKMDQLLHLATRFECHSIASLIEQSILSNTMPGHSALIVSDSHGLSQLCSRELKKLTTRDNYRDLQKKPEYMNLSDALRTQLFEEVLDKMATGPTSTSQSSRATQPIINAASNNNQAGPSALNQQQQIVGMLRQQHQQHLLMHQQHQRLHQQHQQLMLQYNHMNAAPPVVQPMATPPTHRIHLNRPANLILPTSSTVATVSTAAVPTAASAAPAASAATAATTATAQQATNQQHIIRIVRPLANSSSGNATAVPAAPSVVTAPNQYSTPTSTFGSFGLQDVLRIARAKASQSAGGGPSTSQSARPSSSQSTAPSTSQATVSTSSSAAATSSAPPNKRIKQESPSQ